MMNPPRHRRFAWAFGLGLGLYAASVLGLGQAQAKAALLGFDGFALTYLLLMAEFASKTSAADLHRHSETADEGIVMVVFLTFGAVSASLAAIVLVLTGVAGMRDLLSTGLALVAVPLGWAVVQTLAAFRYAHLHYAPNEARHLGFPGTQEPDPWDFLYFAFVIGMTAQTSDVTVETPRMRRVVLSHSVAAFFYNTVILALAVNAGLALAR